MRRTRTRTGGCLLALALATAGSAIASPVPATGLSLVPVEGGWARYISEGDTGPVQYVVRVGKTGTHQGRRGRWIHLDVDVPVVGTLTLSWLVAGKVFSAQNVLVTRVDGGGIGESAGEMKRTENKIPKLPAPKELSRGTLEVFGKTIPVVHYQFEEGIQGGWSPKVPGFGLAYVAGGPGTTALVAFGVGGDPWQTQSRTHYWPDWYPPKVSAAAEARP